MIERLAELEVAYTHQQRMIDELNEIVTDQQRAIDALRREVRTLREQMSLALPSLTRTPDEEEPPPHY